MLQVATAFCRDLVRTKSLPLNIRKWVTSFLCEMETRDAGAFLGAIAEVPKATIRFVMSVCTSVRALAWSNSASTGRISMEFNI